MVEVVYLFDQDHHMIEKHHIDVVVVQNAKQAVDVLNPLQEFPIQVFFFFFVDALELDQTVEMESKGHVVDLYNKRVVHTAFSA